MKAMELAVPSLIGKNLSTFHDMSAGETETLGRVVKWCVETDESF
jgi:hypothetical protein